MGGDSTKMTIASQPPTVVMMVGLQGAGKTTNAAKLAGLMRKQNGKRPLLVACDVYRPAAIQQLEVVGETAGHPCLPNGTGRSRRPLPRPPLSTPKSTATTWSSWTPPVASMWMRR